MYMQQATTQRISYTANMYIAIQWQVYICMPTHSIILIFV